ncbi:MAG: hypothetical protein JRH15_01990 [Deltaproteobacteria bacterium]|nr:hypothetical protein [Deltaproteobacteria bacterium]
MVKFVVQSRDPKGHWFDYQAAWDFEEARVIEATILNDLSAIDSHTGIKQTRIVAADQAKNLYHL